MVKVYCITLRIHVSIPFTRRPLLSLKCIICYASYAVIITPPCDKILHTSITGTHVDPVCYKMQLHLQRFVTV